MRNFITFHIPHSTFHIPHSTFRTPHSAFRIGKVGREGIEPLVATPIFCDAGVTIRPEEHDP